ncbi:MAG: iron-containing alcohol dehydrogenase [Thermoplasmataceae archaeon]
MWFFRSPQIIYGEEALTFLNSLHMQRALIVTDRFLSGTEILNKVRRQIVSAEEVKVFGKIDAEPKLSQIIEGRDLLEDFSPDFVIGLGGGSAMDAAKILFALNEIPSLSPYDITPINDFKLHVKSTLVEIPTTSGTGSECSWAAVFTDDVEKRKNEIASPQILADYAILDPSLTVGLPREQTVNTATDALTHAIEAYTSQWKNVFSDSMAEKAISLISSNILKVLENPSDLNSRNNMHIGASMAGISFSNSQIGLAHALGHALGAEFKVPHGKAVGLYLPHVISFNYDVARDRYDRLNAIFSGEFRSSDLSQTVSRFLKRIGESRTVVEAGISRDEYIARLDDIVTLASESTGLLTNAKDASSEDLRQLALQVV